MLQLPSEWHNKIDPKGWYMCEYLEGIHVLWDGNNLVTKSGRAIDIPKWFHDPFIERMKLEGILWLGRDRRQELVDIVKQTELSHDWKDVKLVVSDLPEIYGTFIERMKQLSMMFEHHWNDEYTEHLRMSVLVSCKGFYHLIKVAESLAAKGRAGILLYNPKAKYEAGISPHVIKITSSRFHLLKEDIHG